MRTKLEPPSAAPAPSIVAPVAVEPPAPRPPRWPARLGSLAYWGVVLGLVALNLGRVRDLWSPTDLAAIARLVDRNRLDDAEQALRDRLRRAPYEGEARLGLAQVLNRRGDLAGAAREFRLVPPWWPTKPQALFLEGQAARGAGQAIEAEAAWRACLTDDPLHPAPRREFSAAASELIGLLRLEGRQEEAIAVLWTISAGSAATDRPALLQTIMDLRCEAGTLPTDPTALATLQGFAAADPGDVPARLALGRIARREGRLDEAVRWVDAALLARPDDLEARADRLAMLDQQGDQVRFRQEVARLPAAADASGRLWELRGRARELADDPTGAAACYRRAVALRPADEAPLTHLTRCLATLGNAAEAQTTRARAATLQAARLAIPAAYRAVLAGSTERREPGPESGRAQLASLAETLGWSREAAAWKPPGESVSPPSTLSR